MLLLYSRVMKVLSSVSNGEVNDAYIPKPRVNGGGVGGAAECLGLTFV